jgi:hypothetical protein
MNVYGIKMAGVFMFSTSTILLRTRIVPRWIAFLGYGFERHALAKHRIDSVGCARVSSMGVFDMRGHTA